MGPKPSKYPPGGEKLSCIGSAVLHICVGIGSNVTTGAGMTVTFISFDAEQIGMVPVMV